MKKSILAVAIAAAFALISCNKIDNQSNPEPVQEGSEVVISFDQLGGEFNTRSGNHPSTRADGGPTTRAFFDNVAAAEPWEKEIKNSSVLVFNSAGKIVMRKTFSAEEITSMSAKVIVPAEYAGAECTFYAVANYPLSSVGSETTVANIESHQLHPSLYNSSSFETANSAQAMTSGMIMSDHKKVVVQPKGTPTNVSFLLRRPVAKLASKVFIDPSFSAKYGSGKIIVNSAKIMNSNALTPIWNIGSAFYGTERFTTLQYSELIYDGSFANLFYIAENPAVGTDDQVILRISATFDQDGNFTTTDDQIAASWNIKLNGSGKGEIRRNAYYRVQATITGMNSIDGIKALIVADEWETPSTQDAGSLDSKNQNQ